MNRLGWIVGIVLWCACLVGAGQVDIAGSWDTTEGKFGELDVHYFGDPNSGIGITVLDGDIGVATDSWAIGPSVKFNIGPLVSYSLDLIFPGSEHLGDMPAQPFGKLAIPRDFENNTWIFLGATGFTFFPDWTVSPEVSVEYMAPEGNSPYPEDVRVMVGAVIHIR